LDGDAEKVDVEGIAMKNLLTMNEPQQPTIATSEHSGSWKEELSRRNAEIGETPGRGLRPPLRKMAI
jgi:hypothetical protein